MPKPKFPKPWNRKKRGWYLTLDGKQPLPGEGEDFRLRAVSRDHAPSPAEPEGSRRGDGHGHRPVPGVVGEEPGPGYLRVVSGAAPTVRSVLPELRVRELRPFHVQEWIDSYAVESGTKRNLARTVVRCMNWAEEQGIIERTPLAHFKKPKAGSRQTVITPEEYQDILACIVWSASGPSASRRRYSGRRRGGSCGRSRRPSGLPSTASWSSGTRTATGCSTRAWTPSRCRS